MSDYKKITVFEQYDENPFLEELLTIDVSNRRRILAGKDPNSVVNSDGELVGTQVFAVHEKVDTEQFTKLYHKGVVELFKLSKAGIKVFGYFTTITKPHKALIIFDIDDCKEFTGYATNKPIMKGLAELLENKFIARTSKHYKYYINPTMFFNGNRIAFVKIYDKGNTKIAPNTSNAIE